ncbi:ribonuclease HII [Candidatus Micrarchaeota archaeon]|nr:ribonuclease HII [Candidatus Micrarchaeota archaeon]MBD3418068.1 ribonuclease HII [Candidatus Micrarchaeota archaeon]
MPSSIENTLTGIGVTDSKKLRPGRREELFHQIKKMCKHQIRIITASELNERMGRESLNLIEAKEMGALALSMSGKVYLDLPELHSNGFLRKAGLAGRHDVVAEHKADLKYPIVGAASILAKVTRDRLVAELAERIGEEIGSGYTSDERTINALKNPEIRMKLRGEIRKRWSTVERILQPKLTDF